MKRICLGTMITLLYQGRMRSSDKIKDICSGIFAAFGLNIETYSTGLPSHLKSGHDPAPRDLIEAARALPIEEIDKGFEEYVLPLIHNEKHVAIFRAIKEILREDSTILGTSIVGKTVGYEKENILSSNSFDESALLASVVTYAIISTENNKMGGNIREIKVGYVDGFVEAGEDVFFISPLVEQDQVIPLKRTLKDPMFDRIFLKATEMTISGLSNPSTASVFYVDPINCKFRFRDLKDFIINNIGSYVFSRAQIQRINESTKNSAAVGSQAMLKFIRKYGANAGNVLGEIMLYIFLEQELDAPKIMSKIELDEYNRGTVSKSDGVHLLSQFKSGQPFHQLVFGASDIVGDLSTAVDRAFEKIIRIDENNEDELRMVESTTQWTIYDADATQYMFNLMRPQKGGTYKPDMAFGAFLGYTLNLDSQEMDSQKYKIAVKEQLIKDIEAVQNHITDIIMRNRLYGYSFYFFVLPFNDALHEKTNLITELLSF